MRHCSWESAEHEADHGEVNPAGGGSGRLLVIAHEPAAVHQPAEGAFDHPALGQHVEAGHLGQPFDHFDYQCGMLGLHPSGKLRAIEAAVHPQFEQLGIVCQGGGQEGARAFSFGTVGGFERDAQQQPQCVHQQETLAALGFLGGIVTDWTAVGAGAHGLAIETGGGGLGVFAAGLAHLGAKPVVEPGQQTLAGPLPEMMIDRLPRREVFGQKPPLGSGLDQIKDGVENCTQGGARAAPFFGGGQEAAKQVPVVVGEIGLVMGDFHRLKSAAANQSRKKQPVKSSDLCVFLFQTGS